MAIAPPQQPLHVLDPVGSASIASRLDPHRCGRGNSPRWFLLEKRRTEEWEARERFSSVELADKNCKIYDLELTPEELEMYIDLHPFTNTTPYTVVETMSVAKAVVLFRSVVLRHMLIMPKFQGPEISPLVGILTRQDLRAHNILGAFPHLAKKSKAH
ncbi:chloride channel protein CLC-a-like [Triticum dicoccoides]|uniref:chloride channel protein CLC-a-like n=1 Tax=Triticum dicoccoides TaxID=85692 RepID=UPI001891034E|nr:chloride channel protein CLC-a-like [Triticum dicoccoides]